MSVKVGLWCRMQMMISGLRVLVKNTGNELVFATATEEPAEVMERHCDVLLVLLEPWSSFVIRDKLDAFKKFPPRPIVMISSERFGEPNLLELIKRGVSCVVSMGITEEDIRLCLLAAQNGNNYFDPRALRTNWNLRRVLDSILLKPKGKSKDREITARERQIWAALAGGSTIKQIAIDLNVSRKTVEAHKFNLMRKLDIHNRVELTHEAISKGIVDVNQREVVPPNHQVTEPIAVAVV